MSRTRTGFTLIELLLVLVILTVLAAVVVPKLAGRSEQARQAAAKADIANIEGALGMFEVDNGRLPTTSEGLAALIAAPSGLPNWKATLKKLPKDPWGQPYVYTCPGQHNTNDYDLASYGPNQQEGGGDDITNWADK